MESEHTLEALIEVEHLKEKNRKARQKIIELDSQIQINDLQIQNITSRIKKDAMEKALKRLRRNRK